MRKTLLSIAILLVGLISADSAAQTPVTDVANTTRNAMTAATKELLVQLQRRQHSELRRMAHRLSMFTDLAKYAAPDSPRWRIHDFEDVNAFLFSRDYHAALNYGDARGAAFEQVARTLERNVAPLIQGQPDEAREMISRMLATLELADSAAITGTHQTGLLRYNGRRELQAIEVLERHVIDPSQEQSATAIAEKVSGAVLIGARQRQARLQFMLALVEQALIDAKRTRDAEASTMNMQIGKLAAGATATASLVAGTAENLRTWRQP
jgi:hypothetical protein